MFAKISAFLSSYLLFFIAVTCSFLFLLADYSYSNLPQYCVLINEYCHAVSPTKYTVEQITTSGIEGLYLYQKTSLHILLNTIVQFLTICIMSYFIISTYKSGKESYGNFKLRNIQQSKAISSSISSTTSKSTKQRKTTTSDNQD